MQQLTHIAVTACLSLALAACTPAERDDENEHVKSPPTITLPGTTWTVEAIVGESIVGNVSASLSFSKDGRISGSSGCNRYFASYKVNNNKLTIGALAGTKMMCGPAAMNVEHNFLSLLHNAETFSASNTGGLVIAAKNGDTVKAMRSENQSTE